MKLRDNLFKGGMSVSFGKSFAKRYGNLTVGEGLELNKKAVEKLKAWKRLKEKGIRFIYDEADYETGYPTITCCFGATYEEFTKIINDKIREDLSSLFGGEE